LSKLAVEDGLYAAAVRNGLVADDGERQVWAVALRLPRSMAGATRPRTLSPARPAPRAR
jgi:hypothetical protein